MANDRSKWLAIAIAACVAQPAFAQDAEAEAFYLPAIAAVVPEAPYGPQYPDNVATAQTGGERYRIEPVRDPWVERGNKWALLNLGASIADAALTCDAIKRGVAHEGNPLLGHTCTSVVSRKALFAGVQTGLFALIQKDNPKKAAKLMKINFMVNGGAVVWGLHFTFKGRP